MRQTLLMMITLFSVLSVAHAADNGQLSSSEMKTAVKMNEIYAHHMYSSSCLERQRMMYVSPILTPAEKNSLMVEYAKACDCLANKVLKDSNPNDVIGYVTYMDGSIEPGTKRVKPDPQTREKNSKIMTLGHEPGNRKSCGFKQ